MPTTHHMYTSEAHRASEKTDKKRAAGGQKQTDRETCTLQREAWEGRRFHRTLVPGD